MGEDKPKKNVDVKGVARTAAKGRATSEREETKRTSRFLDALSRNNKPAQQPTSSRSFKMPHASAGMLLFWVAAIVFAFSKISGIPNIYGFIAFGFMLYTSFVLLENRGTWFVMGFIIWFFIYGAENVIEAPLSIIPIVIFGLLGHGLLNISKKKPFLEGFLEDAGFGLALIVLFLIDVGYLILLLEIFSITLYPIIGYLLDSLPLWAYLGWFYLIQSEGERGAGWYLSLVVGVLYLIVILGLAPGAAVGEEILPSLDEAVQAKQEFTQEISACKKTMARSGFWWSCISSGDSSNKCINDKIKKCEVDPICVEEQKYERGSTRYVDCVQQETAKMNDLSLQISGSVDKYSKEPTKVEFRIDSDDFSEFSTSSTYPVEFTISNPRKEKISGEISCFFKSRTKAKDIAGSIQNSNTFETTLKKDSFSFICEPETMVPGKYEVVYNLTLEGLKTTSHLVRAFAPFEPELREQMEQEIKQVIPNPISSSPKDFARINFNIGYSKRDPIITNNPSKNIILRSNIENLGKGRITNIKDYSIDITGLNILSGDQRCVHGTNVIIKKKSGLPDCTLEIVDPFLQIEPTEDWQIKEFLAHLNYDYMITAKKNIEISELTNT